MNGRYTPSWPLIYASVINIPGHSMQKFNTHDHFGTLIFFLEKSHIPTNAAPLEHGWICSPPGNITPLYLDEILCALKVSNDTLLNHFESLFIHISSCLRQLWRDAWYVTSWMQILQPHTIWWCWVIFCNCGGRSN